MDVASKSAQQEPEKAEVIEEALDALDTALDRVKVIYEQYFLGIQKQPPQHLHTEVERKLRELAQLQIRNTALRYRLATLQQKFGSYNSYWRRTLREIEAGRYHRSLSRVTRHAAATGAEIPPEILAAMPQRMREQVRRDREAALAIQHRRAGAAGAVGAPAAAPPDDEDAGSFVRESTDVRERALEARGELHVLEEDDVDLDMDTVLHAAAFDVEDEAEAAAGPGSRAAGAPLPGFIAQRAARATPPPIPAPPIPAPPIPAPPIPAPPIPAPSPPKLPPLAPSQRSRPNPIAPGSSSARPPAAPAAELKGPFPRAAPPRSLPPVGPPPRPPGTGYPPALRPALRPAVPPGMSETDVNALYARYVEAKQTIGQAPSPDSFDKLMKTIHAEAPKIMKQYQAKAVDFSVAIQDDQVVIRAKPRR